MRATARVILSLGTLVIFVVGIFGVPSDLTAAGSWATWVKENTYSWPLALGGLVGFAVIQQWEPVSSWLGRHTKRAICRHADRLSGEIFYFLNVQRAFDPRNVWPPPEGVSGAEITRQRIEYSQNLTMSFESAFGGEVKWLVQQLHARRIFTDRDAWQYGSYSASEYEIGELARDLRAAAIGMGCVKASPNDQETSS